MIDAVALDVDVDLTTKKYILEVKRTNDTLVGCITSIQIEYTVTVPLP